MGPTPLHTNRLSAESSPYLLQHQHNPVDWYPWGPDAFEAARSQNKPIFLSVGYSTCYWCHVMERQCFENKTIAAEMNRLFVNIKVDREQRPDVDQLYMTAVQVLTRHGGWPMSVFLMPDLRPFYGGTYFPPADSHGRPGFPTLLRALSDAYSNRRSDVEKSASQLRDILGQLAQPSPPASPMLIDDRLIADLIEQSVADYDPRFGGFGSAPKFPRQTLLELLLVYNRRFPDAQRMQMVTHTLDAMADGGIHDHLGGGFHRYSTDERWLTPHFEIMLYDNALLAWCYVDAFAQTGREKFADVARGIFDFVLREMTSPDGGFYTAIDAEVDAQEGLSYLWTRAEVVEILSSAGIAIESIDRFCRTYGLDDGPNFADPHQAGAGRPDRNVLFLAHRAEQDFSPLRRILYTHRNQRKQPSLDTKIITSWNALMIRALAHGAKTLNRPEYHAAARRAADLLLSRRRADPAIHMAFLDDYAFLIEALIALEDDSAKELTEIMLKKFGDPDHAGLFFSQAEAGDLIVRQKTGSDSPLPSGNAIAARVLSTLGRGESAAQILGAFAGQLQVNGPSMSAMIQAAHLYQTEHGTLQVAASGAPANVSTTPSAQHAVTITTRWQDPLTLNVALNIADEFHINSDHPPGGLVATRLSIAGAESIAYPPGDVYEKSVTIVARFTEPPKARFSAALTYQPCDRSACFSATTRRFEVDKP